MSDNLRRYRAIKERLFQLYPEAVSGHLAETLNVLAMFINGIVASKSTHTREVAKKTPTGAKVSSREKQLSRWYQNEGVTHERYMLPFVEQVLSGLSERTLTIIIDGSEVGRHCMALMVNVVYQRRAIPLLWSVVKGNKGHLPTALHLELLEQLRELLPEGADVVLLGDGEFDSVELQSFVTQQGWHYVCRTAKNSQVCDSAGWQSLEEIALCPGCCLSLPDVCVTQQAYGPVLVILWWRQGEKEPIYLVTNFHLTEEACFFYRKRMRIETFFSDQKSKGFHLHKSHISDPLRLARLMIAASLAYIWIVALGVLAIKADFVKLIHRTHRCDLSLFQLGLDLLEFFLNEDKSIPFGFCLKYGQRNL
jgi:Transposase DDE domain